jgi:serine/threonine protein kinase/tetratricopeptide (TPR) repeat protein
MSPDRWQEIEAVFQGAFDLSPDERGAYLSEKCSGDEELRGEVEKLLANIDSAESFIESPVWTDSRFLNSSAKKVISKSLEEEIKEADPEEFKGKHIGAYQLLRELGRGGMGAVFLAERADGEFSQNVAIKLIKRGMDSDFIVRRFRHERQILASFEHPFIARLLDGGTTQDGMPYFVMEFVEGETLYNFCDKQRLNIRDRLKLFQKVCSAIDYAHERQIIHRDIKPSNILINRQGAPKLLDFGIAKILDPNLIHESINPTASVMRLMTPDYASPEQVQGTDVAPASDIYSLGILLYELLTGHRPYNFAGRALHEVSRVICEVAPQLPSEILEEDGNLLPQYFDGTKRYADVRGTAPDKLKTEIKGKLDNIIMKALAKQAGDRYLTVKDLSEDITRYLQGREVEAAPYSAAKSASKDRAAAQTSNNRSLAVLPFKFLNLGPSGDTDGFLGLGLADALISRLSKVRRFTVRPTSSVLAFNEEIIDPIRAGKELHVDFILDGNIKKAGERLRVTVQLLKIADNATIWATSIDETLTDVFSLEDTLSNRVLEALLPQLTGSELEDFSKRGTENPEAFEHYLRGRYYFNSFTEEGFAKSFVSFHEAIAADPDYAHAYSGIADYYNWLGILGVLPPHECFQPAILAATKAVELDENLSEANASLGFSLHAGNYEWATAEHYLGRAIELNHNNANAYVWYSIVLFTEGKFAEGLELARRAVDLDPLTPFHQHNVAWGLYYARRYEEAINQYKQVINNFPTYSMGYYGLSKIYRIMGRTKEAIKENARAKIAMNDGIFSLLSEAECYAADGQTELAKKKLQALIDVSDERYVSPYQLSLVCCYLNDREQALEFLEKAFEIKEAWLNWMGIEPVFDKLKDDARFNAILEKTGYDVFFNNFSTSAHDLQQFSAETIHLSQIPPGGGEKLGIHNSTTLVIDPRDRTSDAVHTTHSEDQRKPSKIWIYAAVFFMVVLVGLGIWRFGFDGGGRVSQIVSFQNPSLIILPFKSTDKADQTLGIGLADALSQKLGSIKEIQVISASSGRALAEEDPYKQGNEFGRFFVLRGNLEKTGGGLKLSAEMVNSADGRVLWTQDFTAPSGDLFKLQTQLAEKIWTSLEIEPLPMERQQIYKSYTNNQEAYELYLIGRSQMTTRTPGNLRNAIETFSRSVETDKNFALSYIGLADAYSLLMLYDVEPPADAYTKAEENALKALAIDDDLAEAHASLGYIKFNHKRERAGAELEFRRAIQLNPSYAQAHHWFALALTGMNRPLEAISEAQIAQRLDPRSLVIKSATGIAFFNNGQFDEALAECDKALVMNPSFVPALKIKRWVYQAIGKYEEANDVFQKERNFAGGLAEDPGWKVIEVQVKALNEATKPEALADLNKIVADKKFAANVTAFGYETALAYNLLGEEQKALEWLEKAEAAHAHSINYLEVDPRFAGLRGNPRYIKLIKKLNQ